MKSEKEIVGGETAALFGVYASRIEVDKAIEFLMANGFNTSDCTILLQTSERSPDLSTAKIAKDRQILLSVHAANFKLRSMAAKYLKQSGAKDISSTGKIKGTWKKIPKPLEATYRPDRFLMNEDGVNERRNI